MTPPQNVQLKTCQRVFMAPTPFSISAKINFISWNYIGINNLIYINLPLISINLIFLMHLYLITLAQNLST